VGKGWGARVGSFWQGQEPFVHLEKKPGIGVGDGGPRIKKFGGIRENSRMGVGRETPRAHS